MLRIYDKIFTFSQQKCDFKIALVVIPMANGIYIYAHVLLNLLNSLQKSDKMLGFVLHFICFFNLFNKFNNTLTFDPLYIAHS